MTEELKRDGDNRELPGTIAHMEHTIATLRAKLADSERAAADWRAAFDLADAKTKDLRAKNAVAQNTNAKLTAALTQARADLEAERADKQVAQDYANKYVGLLDQARAEAETWKARFNEERKGADGEVVEMGRQLLAARAEAESLRAENQALKGREALALMEAETYAAAAKRAEAALREMKDVTHSRRNWSEIGRILVGRIDAYFTTTQKGSAE